MCIAQLDYAIVRQETVCSGSFFNTRHNQGRSFYHLLLFPEGTHFRDLGPAYFDRLNPERVKHYLVSRLERLGFKVTLEPQQVTT